MEIESFYRYMINIPVTGIEKKIEAGVRRQHKETRLCSCCRASMFLSQDQLRRICSDLRWLSLTVSILKSKKECKTYPP